MKIALEIYDIKKSTYYNIVDNKNKIKTRKLDEKLVKELEDIDGYGRVYEYRKVTKLFEIIKRFIGILKNQKYCKKEK